MPDKGLLKCKACGFKTESDKLGSVCPACGVDKRFFQEYKDSISFKRRRFIELHIHPVLVHLPTAVAAILFIVLISGPMLSGIIRQFFLGSAVLLSVALPIFVVAGTLSGVFDGIARFKKMNRPLLLRKLYISIAFFIVSSILVFLVLIFGFDLVQINILNILLSLAALILAGILGKIGGSLADALLPGK